MDGKGKYRHKKRSVAARISPFFYYICEIEVRPASARPLSCKDALTMTIFSKIAAGEIPSYKCAENEDFYAFLDINPAVSYTHLTLPTTERV